MDTNIHPDFSIWIELDESTATSSWPAGEYVIEAWDCVDLSWWSPVSASKIVQVSIDQDECFGSEVIYTEYLDCNAMSGSDREFRDVDADGVSEFDGDCNDNDPKIGGDWNGDGISDCIDIDGDGVSPDQGDCDETSIYIIAVDADHDGTNDCTDDDGDGLSEMQGDADDEHADTSGSQTASLVSPLQRGAFVFSSGLMTEVEEGLR